MTKNYFLEDLKLSRFPSEYLKSIELPPFPWQELALSPLVKRLILNCARQSGKSTVTAGTTVQVAKYQPRSLCVICAPSQTQAEETMKKVEDIASKDKSIVFVKSSTMEKELSNGSRIIALPGTERSVRGYSGPKVILLDEASRINDETYMAIRPMLTGQESAKLILMSTPAGKSGFFYEAWRGENNFTKILVKPRFKLSEDGTEIIDDIPEEEFKALWKSRGVHAFYSPRHTKAWLEEELNQMGAMFYRQEYDVEFTAEGLQLFSDTQIEGIFGGGGQAMYDPNSQLSNDARPFNFMGYK